MALRFEDWSKSRGGVEAAVSAMALARPRQGFRTGQRVVATGQAWWDGDREGMLRRGAVGTVLGSDGPGYIWVHFENLPAGSDADPEQSMHCVRARAIVPVEQGAQLRVDLEAEEEEEEEAGADPTRMWEQWTPPEPPKSKPSEVGSGALYEVVGQRVVSRAAPSTAAPVLGCKLRGKTVELFEWDETLRWRRHVDSVTWVSGWMMLDHPDHGPLLRPKGIPFQVRPLVPVCEAAREDNVDHLSALLGAGQDVNARGADGRTPLMIAAAAGHLNACVALLRARADASACVLDGDARLVALQLAADQPTESLLSLLMGQDCDPTELLKALDALRSDVRCLVEDAVQQAARVAAEKAAAAAQVMAKVAELRTAVKEPPASADEPAPAEYEVVHAACAIRSAPSMDAPAVGARRQGAVVGLCCYDETGAWRRLAPHVLGKGRGDGWMLLRHAELGELLRPLRPEEDLWHPPALDRPHVAAADQALPPVPEPVPSLLPS